MRNKFDRVWRVAHAHTEEEAQGVLQTSTADKGDGGQSEFKEKPINQQQTSQVVRKQATR